MQHHNPPKTSLFLSIQEHLAAFVIAWLLVAWLTGVFFLRDGLAADITGATSPQSVQSLPLQYAVEPGQLVVSSTMQFTSATSMTFFVVFDPKSVVLQLEKATSPYSFTFAPGMENMVQVTVMVHGDIPAWGTVFTLPMTGIEDNITIANAGILREKGTFESVAIQKK
jgi:hypothetical protein